MFTDQGISFQSFLREVQSGRIDPVYLLEGEERYLRRRAISELIERVADAPVRDFNVSRIDVESETLGTALAIARQLPMMSPKRLVIVTGFEAVNDDVQIEILQSYLADPGSTTVLVFDSEALDSRRSLTSLLRKMTRNIRFSRLKDDEASRWVRDYAQSIGGAFDRGSSELLVGMIGSDLSRLVSETEKLVAYANGRPISTADIERLVLHTREHNVFELTDAILSGGREKATRLVNRLLASGDEPLLILGAIARLFRQMLSAKELMRRSLPNADVAKAVGMSPWAVTKLNEKVRQIETRNIVEAIRLISDADLAIKSSLATPRLQLEVLVCNLTQLVSDQQRRVSV